MKLGTSPPNSSLKSAMGWVLNLTYNPSLRSNSHTELQTEKKGLDWTYIVAENFWSRDRQRSFFDVRVFNPLSPTYHNTSLAQCFRRNELEKRRAYDERIREIEHGSFSPLVFSTSGSMGPTATTVYKRLAAMIAEMNNKIYSKTIHWLVEMPPKLFTSTLCHHVPQRKQISAPPASTLPCQHHRPSLL